MATPQAIGMPARSVKNHTAKKIDPTRSPNGVLSPTSAVTMMPTTSSTVNTTPTKASHLICWRTSPVAPR
jgi:hypothetical protein